MSQRSDSTRGLTLIELVAAMAIFALVAVMGAQALSGMLRQRDGLTERAERATELEIAIALIRADLSTATPLLFYPPATAAPASPARRTPNGFDLSVAGQPDLDLTAPPKMHRVSYRLDRTTGQLWRRTWRSLTPAGPTAQTPEVLILTGVSDLTLRSHWGQPGWRTGLASVDVTPSEPSIGDSDGGSAIPEVYSSVLPLAIEVTLHLDGIGPVPLLEAMS